MLPHANAMPEAVRYEIEHVSRYTYSASVQRCAMLLCIEPRSDGGQRLLDFEIETRPQISLSRETDSFGNARHVLDISRSHETLEIVARSSVVVSPGPAVPDRAGIGAWEEIHASHGSFLDWEFANPSALIPASRSLDRFVDRHGIAPDGDPLESLLRLSDTLYRRLHYVPGSTTAESSVDDILASDRGVCQDYTHAMIAVARSWGIPSRYVSGYLVDTGRSDHQAADNASHAWVECRLPNLGWLGFDPTNGSLATETHVRIAAGRDYRDVAPTRGVIRGGGQSTLEVDVRIRSAAAAPGAASRRHEKAPGALRPIELNRADGLPDADSASDQ